MNYIEFSPEVISAQKSKKAIVALESTIISHGMPYPQNLETAMEVEAVVRSQEAYPATIALIDGKIKVGLTEVELKNLAQSNDVLKVSRRDFASTLISKKYGATTVAATMIAAHLAKIPVFATGGIGGVHRGVEESLDISADLTELAQTNVAVVCAGAKSILDLPRTLEYLETQGVPVLGFQTEEFPAFYSRHSGLKLDKNVQTITELAQIINCKWNLGLKGGIIVANPIPIENELPASYIDPFIHKALEEAKLKNIKGKDITPFLLAKIKDITSGKSLESNIALIKNNAKIAALLAVELRSLS